MITVNDAFGRHTGHSLETLRETPFTSHLSTVPPPLEDALSTGSIEQESMTLTLFVETADGESVRFESYFETVPGDEGDDQRIVGVLHRRPTSSTWTADDRELKPPQGRESVSAKAFVALADALSDGIIVLDTESQIQYANPAVERILGYTPADLVGGSKLSIIPERLRQTHLNALNRYLETGEKHIDWEYVELPGQHTDGHEVPLGISLNDFLFEGKRYFVGLFRDVSAQKEAEQALRRREQRLNRYKEYTDDVLNAIDDMFYVLDTEGNMQRWNRTLSAVTDYEDEEIESMHALEFFDGDERDSIVDAIETGFETGTARVEADLTTKSGMRIPYEFVAATLDDPDGKPVLAGIGRDITERKAQRRRIEENERRYRTLVEHFPNGVVALFDEDLRYTAVGGELLDELGLERSDAIGTTVQERYPEELLETVEPYFRAALDGDANSFEVEYHNRHLSAYTLPVRDATGDIFAGMLMVQDITERTEIQRQLEESNERLEQFAYAASHDLQEPLRMITSYLQLIEQRYGDELDEDGQEFIEFAVDGADRMRDMIDGLLQYSRVDTQGDPLQPVDLTAVVEDVTLDLQLKIEEEAADIELEELPRVSGDSDQLRQIFQNLLSNAIEYSGDEPPRIRIAAEHDGEMWRISVHDDGIGIDPDEADRIFQVFERLHASTERDGTGIGLALCERIVERHGGEIWVESQPEGGSTFHFTLPSVTEPAA
ncbi:PAS domain S-box protein [Natrialbaceae archaeon A-arb3/5]